MRFLFLEPFYGGSHRDFADGLVGHSRHRIDLATLPARFWKWRMRGAALHFVRTVPPPTQYDGLIVSDLLSLSDLRALWGDACPPALVFFHENQLSYPLPPGESMDYQFGFTDVTTALAADLLLFNSNAHREEFFSRLPAFLRKMPEFRPLWTIDVLRDRAQVMYPGCHFAADPESDCPNPDRRMQTAPTPLIVWNHRWEFDKQPEAFFRALTRALEQGHEFLLSLMGECFQKVPKPFLEAKRALGNRVIQYGYVPSRTEYYQRLSEGDVIISTAIQENFGISVIEAIRHGCFPLLPKRLSYPELIPQEYHRECLYADEDELTEGLCAFLANPAEKNGIRHDLSLRMARFSWVRTIDSYDRLLEELPSRRNSHRSWHRRLHPSGDR